MKVTIFTKIYPHELVREVEDLARWFWPDYAERGEYYYKDYSVMWRPEKQGRHMLVAAIKYINESEKTASLGAEYVISILLSRRNLDNVLRVVMRFDESLPFASVLYQELVDINRRLGYDGAVKIEGARR